MTFHAQLNQSCTTIEKLEWTHFMLKVFGESKTCHFSPSVKHTIIFLIKKKICLKKREEKHFTHDLFNVCKKRLNT